jgi:hypothetical protein
LDRLSDFFGALAQHLHYWPLLDVVRRDAHRANGGAMRQYHFVSSPLTGVTGETAYLRGVTMNLMNRLWTDEAGFVISFELMLVATILVIGMIVGLSTIREQLVQELADVAGAISEVNQSYSFAGITGHFSSTAGSNFVDLTDACDPAGEQLAAGTPPNCVNVAVPSSNEGT